MKIIDSKVANYQKRYNCIACKTIFEINKNDVKVEYWVIGAGDYKQHETRYTFCPVCGFRQNLKYIENMEDKE